LPSVIECVATTFHCESILKAQLKNVLRSNEMLFIRTRRVMRSGPQKFPFNAATSWRNVSFHISGANITRSLLFPHYFYVIAFSFRLASTYIFYMPPSHPLVYITSRNTIDINK